MNILASKIPLTRQTPAQRLAILLIGVIFVTSVTVFFTTRRQGASAVSYNASTEDLANPERGFFTNYITTDVGTPISAALLQETRAKNMTLVRRIYVIPSFRNAPLSQAFLDLVSADMTTARGNGVKYILRFAYNFDAGGQDATQARILEHISQLKPVLTNNADVIAQVEAGFIGEWGEWHDSSNGLVNNAAMTAISNALLDALPKDRTIELRYNYHKRAIYGNAPLTSAEAFKGTNKARIGHHNDCFLASADDWGTYWDSMPLDQQKAYLSQENQFVPQSGETCNNHNNAQYTNCENAQKDLVQMRWSSLNKDFEAGVIAGWQSGGCLDAIQKKLGYRLRLIDATIQNEVRPGSSFTLTANIANDGYASPYNPRKLEIILRNSATKAEYFAATTEDPRTWLGGTQRQISVTAGVPSGLPTGNYDVLISLPDPAANLYNKPQYSIRLANTDVWEATTGYNALSKTITVSASASGSDYTGPVTFQPRNGSPLISPTPPPATAWNQRFALPGKIEVENYRDGGEGTGYHDTDTTNRIHEYRNDGVDIEKTSDTGGGYNVGWTDAGEWLAYDVSVATAGSYTFAIRAGTVPTNTKLHLEVDGTNVTGSLTIPSTGAWQTYQTTTSQPFDLTAGNHTLKLVLDTGNYTLNYFTIAKQNATPTPTPVPTPTPSTAPTPPPTLSIGNLSQWSGQNDATYSYYEFRYTGTPHYFHTFIDSDNNPSTGYSINGRGADYMLENSNAYRYTGSGGSWGWAGAGNIGFTSASGRASWTAARSQIGQGSTSSATIIFQSNDNSGTPLGTSPAYTHTFSATTGAITQYWAENNTANITYHATISPASTYNHVYIDTDQQTGTGYAIGGIGANYMIENDGLYRYTGNGTSWGWAWVGSAGQVTMGNTRTWTISRSSIGATSSTQNRVVFNVTGGSPEYTTPVYTHIFSN